MPQLQFDAQLTSKDGTAKLFIRGPFVVPDGVFPFEMRLVPMSEMGKWPQIWKSEEVEDETTERRGV